jgi:hypothetical protein
MVKKVRFIVLAALLPLSAYSGTCSNIIIEKIIAQPGVFIVDPDGISNDFRLFVTVNDANRAIISMLLLAFNAKLPVTMWYPDNSFPCTAAGFNDRDEQYITLVSMD